MNISTNEIISTILLIVILVLIWVWLIMLSSHVNKIQNEIKESRVREDLLLKEIKLLDYQVNVLTNHVLGEE